MGTVVIVLWSGYGCQMIQNIKGSHSEVEASKSDKWLRNYGHLRITITRGFGMHTFAIKNPKIFWARTIRPPLLNGLIMSPLHLYI